MFYRVILVLSFDICFMIGFLFFLFVCVVLPSTAFALCYIFFNKILYLAHDLALSAPLYFSESIDEKDENSRREE